MQLVVVDFYPPAWWRIALHISRRSIMLIYIPHPGNAVINITNRPDRETEFVDSP